MNTEAEIETNRANICESILYAFGSRDLTDEEKAHFISNAKTRKIITDWSHPDDDWTDNNKKWFYGLTNNII